MLFAFDPLRQAVMLCGGDKTGDKRFYATMMPIAEKEFMDYLNALGWVMAKPLNKLLKKVNPDVVQAATVRAEQEILELRISMLREQLELSQVEMAHRLGISQPSVANLEKRGQEIKLSSLKRYVEAMGGKLTVDVQLPDGRHIGMNF